MTLRVFTCRLGSRAARDPDVLDVTREGEDPIGVVFAPSWDLLRPFLERRKAQCREFAGTVTVEEREAAKREARLLEAGAWSAYVDGFKAEMRVSWKANRSVWERLLARERVVLACFCRSAAHCHRTVIARDILPRLGASYEGEIASRRDGLHVEKVEVSS